MKTYLIACGVIVNFSAIVVLLRFMYVWIRDDRRKKKHSREVFKKFHGEYCDIYNSILVAYGYYDLIYLRTRIEALKYDYEPLHEKYFNKNIQILYRGYYSKLRQLKPENSSAQR